MAPALRDLVERDLVRVLDLLVLKKDADGTLRRSSCPIWIPQRSASCGRTRRSSRRCSARRT